MKYQEKIIEWTQVYLKHVREVGLPWHVEKEEGYKFYSVETFQEHFDIDAPDLAAMLEQAIFPNNLVAASQYFPRKMLLTYAQMFPDETRGALGVLFDESEPIEERITKAEEAFDRINDQLNKERDPAFPHTYIKLRFLSLLLSFRFPEKYNPLKPAEWKVFARFLDPSFRIPHHTPSGTQYGVYNEYIEELRAYIKGRPEFESIRAGLTEHCSFKDGEYRWLVQDIIFVTARLVANLRAGQMEPVAIDNEEETIVEQRKDVDFEEEKDEDGTGFMPLEKYLEEYVIRNWDLIDFGEELSLYKDDDGTPGQQYTTDVGIIDILAKDKEGNFVVIELKRAESGYKVVGQVLNYMGWVKENLVTSGKKVRGMIIVGRADATLKSAVSMLHDQVTVKEYTVKMSFRNPK